MRLMVLVNDDHIAMVVGRVSYTFHKRLKRLRKYDTKNTSYLIEHFSIDWECGFCRGFAGISTENFFAGYCKGFFGIAWKHVKVGVSWAKPQENNNFFSK